MGLLFLKMHGAFFAGLARKNRAIRSNPADFALQNPQGFPLLSTGFATSRFASANR
jgi:hypothetical protein